MISVQWSLILETLEDGVKSNLIEYRANSKKILLAAEQMNAQGC